MEQITLDLIPKGSLPVLHASQYDDGRQWQVNLKENGEDYTLTNETIVLGVRKGDGCAVTCAVAIESGKKYVILTSTEQMCAVAGQNLAELQITKDNTKIGTLNFILQVERDPLAAGISSGTEIHDLQHQVDECVHTAFETIGASGLPYDNTESGLTADNVQQAIDEVNEKASSLPSYVYTKEETDALLADKADKATLEADYYDRAETDALLADKADASALGDYYTKSETNTKLSGKADKGSVYTTAQVNTLLGDKADKSDLDNYYTKSQTNSLLNDKANKANVYDKNYLNGIFNQIDNALTDVNMALGQKANSSDVYNKTSIDTALSAKANANAVYTKAETDAKVGGLIDDTSTASNKTWSSNKISAELEALLPVDEVSGAVANFTTSVVKPLVNLKAYFKAIQEAGTPTPQSPKAISGVSAVVIGQQSGAVDVAACFRGLFKGTHGFINLGSFTWNYSTEGSRFSTTTTVSDISLASNFTNLVANGYNTISSIVAFSQMQNLDLKRSGSTGYINIRDDSFGGNATNFKNAMNSVYLIYELATPTTPTITPEQYQTLCAAFGINGSTTLINLGGTYYGGYVEQDKDGHRQLVVTHKIFTFSGVENWQASANFFYLSAGTLDDTPIQASVISSNGLTISPMTNKQISLYPNYGINSQYISMESTVADIQSYLSNGIQFLYELAEPFTADLPDGEPIITFNGVNNVYNDSGDTTAEYKLSIEEYVAKKIAEITDGNRSLNTTLLRASGDEREDITLPSSDELEREAIGEPERDDSQR